MELLAMELRGIGVNTFVSHSSLSLEERRAEEDAFAQGINVGDLDRVIQVEAPATVSSFLQRSGRTGRRVGASRNCLFLATTEDAFLRALGLLHLWRDGFVEPIQLPALLLHICVQQVLRYTCETGMLHADAGLLGG